ncbi:unnamed protein product [Polarella glacialis]|uniref:DNA (cytosine-5-)-methyltransferase n=1 Tax=Polarella glacialis TaxID=89957 RepID=A0A813GHV2_POLGL|nr:unnamed protein product [Polarella glacialis]CAE8678946.1 unnamed protein product [Polarella glacialis]
MCSTNVDADFDVSGLPCQDMSRNGDRKLRAGTTVAVYMTHAKYHRAKKTPLLLIECTEDLDMGMIEDNYGDSYDLYQLFMSPSDSGHAGSSRYRTYVICAHTERTVCLHDPFMLQAVISRKVSSNVATRPSDYLVATQHEVMLDAESVALQRRIPFEPGNFDLSCLLTARERQSAKDYCEQYRIKFPGRDPEQDEDFCVYLGDSASNRLTWSAVSNRIPTFRMNSQSGKTFFPMFKRWMVGKERLASLGFPAHPIMAEAMCTPVVFATDPKRASDLAGNSMHLTTCAAAQCIALSCFGPRT